MTILLRMILIVLMTAFAACPALGQGVEALSADGAPLSIRVNEGRLLRTSKPVAAVFIANPAIADVQVQSPRLIYIFGKQAGRTTLFAVDGTDAVVVSGEVGVEHDLQGLRDALAILGGTEDVRLSSIEGGLIIGGSVASAETAENIRRLAARHIGASEEIVNRLRVTGANQINLRVRVAEVSRTVTKQLGVRWDRLFTTGSLALGLAGGNAVALPGAFVGSIAVESGALDLDLMIDALAEEGLLSILAEPNLTALSGEEASFLAGGEFPIPVPQSEDSITIIFKTFGIGLTFTPTLLEGGRISLKVNPEVSELSRQDGIRIGGFDVPALRTRRAETTVELGSGQSFAIAGLLSNSTQQDNSRLPGLGDVPVLGALFRSDNFRRGETELVIIVTPYVVEPVSAPVLATPLDGFAPPGDMNRILFGRNYVENPETRDAVDRALAGRRLNGPAGFMIE